MKTTLRKNLKSYTSTINRKILIISIFLGLVFSLLSGYLAFQYMDETQKQRLVNLKNLVELSLSSIEPIIEQYQNEQISRETALERIRNQLRRMTYYDLNGDNYIFMVHEDGRLLVNPYDQKREMTQIKGMTDRFGVEFVEDLIKVATSSDQQGYVTYDYTVPKLSTSQRKVSYVIGIPEFNALIGTGLYLSDTYRALLFNMLIASIFSIAFLILLVLFTSQSISELKVQNRSLQRENNQRKRAEKDLRITRHSIDISSTAAFWIKKDGRLCYVNQAATHLTGYPPQELINKQIWEIVPRVNQKLFEKYWQELERKQTINFETTIARKSSDNIPVDVVTHLHDFEGDQYAFSWVLDDSDKIKSERERNLLVSVVEQSNDSIIITGLDGTIGYVNPAFEKNTGYSRPEALGQNPRLLNSGEHQEHFFEHLWKTIHHGKIWTGRITSKRKDGRKIEEFATIFPVIDSNGETTNYAAVKRDMTEQVRLEQQLNQAQKMEAVGTLASGIAHDFNNVLSPIFSYAQLLERRLPPENKKAVHFSQQIIKAASRASDLVSQILNFSRNQPEGKSVVEIIPTIKETLKLLRSALPSTIQISWQNDAKATHVLCDPIQIHQVIMNLGINAGHAMQENGGTLEIKLSNFEELQGQIHLQAGNYLLITVRDTGTGMPPEIRDRIFEPFFTTKARGEGTGLGLAISYQIITSLNGDIHLYSEPGKGSVFHIYLPVQTISSEETTASEKTYPTGDETILLVDDEDYNIASLSAMLEDLGYTLVCFTDSRKALQAFQKEPEKYDLVFTDYTMPGLSGIDLGEKINRINKSTPVILISGLSEAIPNDQVVKAGIQKKLSKPIDLADLSITVREILDAASASQQQ